MGYDPFRKLIYRGIRALAWPILKFYHRIEYHGRRNIPKRGPCIFASNHPRYFDATLITTGILTRDVLYMAAVELFRWPLLGRYFKFMHGIPVHRGQHGSESLDVALGRLKQGFSVLIFPEGATSPTGRLRQGRNGVSVLALKAKVPVVPVAIIGTQNALLWGSAFIRPAKVVVRFDKPLLFDDCGALPTAGGEPETIPRETLIATTEKIMAAIVEMLPEEMKPGDMEEIAQQTPGESAIDAEHLFGYYYYE